MQLLAPSCRDGSSAIRPTADRHCNGRDRKRRHLECGTEAGSHARRQVGRAIAVALVLLVLDGISR
jgi:hypothetical protein